MATSFYNLASYSRFNLSQSESDIHILVREYKERVKKQLLQAQEGLKTPFNSFTTKKLSITDVTWLQDNTDKFFKDTANESLAKVDYLSSCGYIFCVLYSQDGEHVIVGHSTGLIQMASTVSDEKYILDEYKKSVYNTYENEHQPKLWYPMFYTGKSKTRDEHSWVQENYNTFLKDTPNEISAIRWFCLELGYITALAFSPNGSHIIVGHSSGLIQMRHGSTGTVLCTLRNIQFPPKPIYALEYSNVEERVCYAACMDGNIYRIEIPALNASTTDPPAYCIRADPALQCLNMQFYGAPGIVSYASPFIQQRFPALSLGLTADQTKMAVGYGDTSIKVYDMETQEAELTFKVHKLRLQFIPKKLQRMHFGQVCALRCHPQKQFMFASAAWDKTLRIWDTRCKVGCVMTFEGVDICSNSIDLNRDQCIAGSWQATEALTVWDLVAKKRVNVIRAQNRRHDVDGEFIYACRFWRSTDYNRKGKYAIIGGSGTSCVEVINLHNRYITCSYPAPGAVLAVTSYENRIAFGGTATTFNVVKFHDPKHEREKYKKIEEPDFDYTKAVSIFADSEEDTESTTTFVGADASSMSRKSDISTAQSRMSKISAVPKTG